MSFQKDIEKFVAKTGASIDTVLQKVAFDIAETVIKRTPVDLGRLKGNWQATLGSPATGQLETTDKDGRDTIVKAATTASKMRAGKTFWFVNNLPYAQAIENGHSEHKAPAGMLKVTVLEYKRMIKKAVKSL